MPFVHRVTARFYEVDRAGIVFFGRIFEMCHATYEELLLAGGSSIEALIAEEGVGMPLVHSEADFVRPIRLHDRIDVALTVERVGERSMTFAYTLTGAGGAEDVRARAKLVHVFVNIADMTPARPPACVFDALVRVSVLEDASQ